MEIELLQSVDVDRAVVHPDALQQAAGCCRPREVERGLVETIEYVAQFASLRTIRRRFGFEENRPNDGKPLIGRPCSGSEQRRSGLRAVAFVGDLPFIVGFDKRGAGRSATFRRSANAPQPG